MSEDPLPKGLHRHNSQYRSRAGRAYPFVYFGVDRAVAIELFMDWKKTGRHPDSSDSIVHLRSTIGALFTSAKKNAAARKLAFELTRQDIVEMLAASGNRCAVTGIWFSDRKLPGARMRPWFPSVDRINAGGVYTRSNCRIVCAYANLALSDLGEAAFATLAAGFLRLRRQRERVPVGYPVLNDTTPSA